MEQRCILVAEDEPILLLSTVRLLTGHGYCVLQARNGAEALDISDCYDGPIDLLITNVKMPIVGGHELAREFKRTRPASAVMMVSALAQPEPDENSVYADALVKPVDPNLLLDHVRALLQGEPIMPKQR